MMLSLSLCVCPVVAMVYCTCVRHTWVKGYRYVAHFPFFRRYTIYLSIYDSFFYICMSLLRRTQSITTAVATLIFVQPQLVGYTTRLLLLVKKNDEAPSNTPEYIFLWYSSSTAFYTEYKFAETRSALYLFNA